MYFYYKNKYENKSKDNEYLPNNIKEGDYIELGQLGAYGLTFRTQFNGYYSDSIYEVCDDPIMTMYDKETNKEFLVA